MSTISLDLEHKAAFDIGFSERQLPSIFPTVIPPSLPANPSSLEQEIIGLQNQNMELTNRNQILEGQFNTFW
jgi:hypothetical protein